MFKHPIALSGTLRQAPFRKPKHPKRKVRRPHPRSASARLRLILGLVGLLAGAGALAEVTRYPLPNNSTFPIAQAVQVTADSTLVFHSGTVPAPANPQADPLSREYWGDTETQARSVFARMKASLEKLGLSFGDAVKMTVFLVGDPELDGQMDFDGFMRAYREHFGTEAQPNLPARSAMQVAGLVRPGMFVEVEAVFARP